MSRAQRPETDQLVKNAGIGDSTESDRAAAHCSKRQVQRIKQNLQHYGTLRKRQKAESAFLNYAQQDVQLRIGECERILARVLRLPQFMAH